MPFSRKEAVRGKTEREEFTVFRFKH